MKALWFENKLWRIAALKALQVFSRRAALGPFVPLRFGDIPEPTIPNPRWIKVRNTSCGLCGTDLHFMMADMNPGCFPAALPGVAKKFLGHELVGEVVETGAEVNSLAKGDRVAMRIDWPCCTQLESDPPCAQCAAGNYALCEDFGATAPTTPDMGGGFSPMMVMHQGQAYKIPETLDDGAAVLLEPMASAVHGVLKTNPQAGDRVLVLGAGTIGLLSIAALRVLAPEVSVYSLARYPFQTRVAEALGATVIHEGTDLYQRVAKAGDARYVKGRFGNEILLGGFDVVYDTVGSDRTLRNAMRWTKAGGCVVLMGINFKPGKLDYSPIWCQEVRVVGINCHAKEHNGQTSFDMAADVLAQCRGLSDDLITHRFPMARYKEAVRAFRAKGKSEAIKIVLEHKSE